QRVFTVELPAGAGPFYVALPSPESTSCVSLVVAEPAAATPETTLAEVAIFTDADAGGGLEHLVAEVAADRPGAGQAERLLATQGAPAARALVHALEAPAPPGRRRLLTLLGSLGVPEAAPALGRALETAPTDERELLVAGLA